MTASQNARKKFNNYKRLPNKKRQTYPTVSRLSQTCYYSVVRRGAPERKPRPLKQTRTRESDLSNHKKGTVLEESLSRDRKNALDIYRKQKPSINIRKAHLRVWQQQLLTLIKKPLKRQVFWICGYNGNEGKSWFQDYIETRYGYARVARLDLRNKTSNILFTLSKRPLQSTDIFLFNDTRATDQADQNYAVLEQIKDGNLFEIFQHRIEVQNT